MNIHDIYADTPESEPRYRSPPKGKTAAIRALRDSDDFRKLREEYLHRAKNVHNRDGTKGEKCWLCGNPIDYKLKYPHPQSWSLDHAIPIKDNPALTLNPSNFRSAHITCNRRRGSDEPAIDLGIPSQIW
jgi:5-methylcytosine-specific restriction endonuclease McrA